MEKVNEMKLNYDEVRWLAISTRGFLDSNVPNELDKRHIGKIATKLENYIKLKSLPSRPITKIK